MVDLAPAIQAALGRIGWPAPSLDACSRLGGVTNTSLQLRRGDDQVVLRIPGVGTQLLIDRKAEQHNSAVMSAQRIDVPLIAFDVESGIKLTRYLPSARSLYAAELREPRCLRAVCQILHRVHRSSTPFAQTWSPLDAGQRLATALRARGEALPAEFAAAAAALDVCRARLLALSPQGSPQVPCHQDLYCENWLCCDGGLLLIDWEHSGPGDPLFDLADLSVQADFDAQDDARLLQIYVDEAPVTDALRQRFWLQQQVSRLSWGLWALARAGLGYHNPAHRARGVAKLQAAQAALGLL